MEGVVLALSLGESGTTRGFGIGGVEHLQGSEEDCGQACGIALMHLLPAHGILDTTIFFTRHEGTLREATAAALEVGATVQVWTTDVELRSLPPQYYATQVIVVLD